jgi:hypothetical protein
MEHRRTPHEHRLARYYSQRLETKVQRYAQQIHIGAYHGWNHSLATLRSSQILQPVVFGTSCTAVQPTAMCNRGSVFLFIASQTRNRISTAPVSDLPEGVGGLDTTLPFMTPTSNVWPTLPQGRLEPPPKCHCRH